MRDIITRPLHKRMRQILTRFPEILVLQVHPAIWQSAHIRRYSGCPVLVRASAFPGDAPYLAGVCFLCDDGFAGGLLEEGEGGVGV